MGIQMKNIQAHFTKVSTKVLQFIPTKVHRQGYTVASKTLGNIVRIYGAIIRASKVVPSCARERT